MGTQGLATGPDVYDLDPSAPPRERLLAAAESLFYAEGVQAVGVDRIIETAGVAKATLYRHFRTKQDLVDAWLRERHHRWLDWFRRETERAAPRPEDRLDTFFDLIARWVDGATFRGCAFLNTASELRGQPTNVLEQVTTHQTEVEALVAEYAAAAGLDLPNELAAELFVLVPGAIGMGLAGRGADARKRIPALARRIVDDWREDHE